MHGPINVKWKFCITSHLEDEIIWLLDILIYIKQDATLHNLYYLETALHISGGNSTHHQERKQMYLQHLVFVTPLLLWCDKYQML